MAEWIEPFELVAKALNTKKETLSIDSKMHEHHSWDSIEHVSIIVEIENNWGLTIAEEDVMNYTTMRAIVELYESSKQKP